MNITITTLSCIVIYLVISKIMQRSEIKRLNYRLNHKSEKVNELVVDNENKIVVLHVENGMLTPDMLDDINENFRELKDKGYYVIAIDKTFNVMEKRFSQELAYKFRSEMNYKEEDE